MNGSNELRGPKTYGLTSKSSSWAEYNGSYG